MEATRQWRIPGPDGEKHTTSNFEEVKLFYAAQGKPYPYLGVESRETKPRDKRPVVLGARD